jgi:xanthine/CO dehydrogenase XdhC/CoxF family maturation factor
MDFYRQHKDEEHLVLATIIATEGSTYRKTGAMLLISRGGDFEGLISGGCLEGDLLQHANLVFDSGAPAHLTYDMSAGEDLVWSLGLGCDGIIHLLLQRLETGRGREVFEHIETAQRGCHAVLLAMVVQADDPGICGRMAALDSSGAESGDAELRSELRQQARSWPDWRAQPANCSVQGQAVEVLLVHMPVQTRVLVCGAGPDALPLVRVLDELGWDVIVADHRPAFARPGRFPAKCTVLQSRPEKLSESVDMKSIDGAVIMSHHLENDAEYLRQVTMAAPRYIAALGPRARMGRLKEMADCRDRLVFGPAGLDIGAELPASIALSIAAEIHAVLNERDGLSLTGAQHE